MHIDHVKAVSFGAIKQQTLKLHKGMTIVQGPNGSGKSTWHAALYAALCGVPPELEAGENFAFSRPWDGSESAVEAELSLAGGQRIRVYQDLTHHRSTVTELSASGSVSKERAFAADFTTELGLDRDSYVAMAWVDQRASEMDYLGLSNLKRSINALVRAEQTTEAVCWLDRRLEDLAAGKVRAEERHEDAIRTAALTARVRRQHEDAVKKRDELSADAAGKVQLLKLAKAAAAQEIVADLRDEISVLEGKLSAFDWQPPDTAPHPTVVAAESALDGAESALHSFIAMKSKSSSDIRPAPRPVPVPGEPVKPYLVAAVPAVFAGATATQASGAGRIGLWAAAALILGAALTVRLVLRRRRRHPPVPAVPDSVIPALPDLEATVDLRTIGGNDDSARLQALRLQAGQAQQELISAISLRGIRVDAQADGRALAQAYREDCDRQANVKADLRADLADRQSRLEAESRTAVSLSVGLDPYDISLARGSNVSLLDERLRKAEVDVAEAEIVVTASDSMVAGLPATEDLEAAVGRAKDHLDRLELLRRTLDKARDRLELAHSLVFQNMAKDVSNELNGHLRDVIKNHQVLVDADEKMNLSLTEKDPDVDSPGPGSGSTLQLSNIFARVALGNSLGQRGVPLILDDFLSRVDDGRMKRALGQLLWLARDRQVVIFTHRAAAAEWAQDEQRRDRLGLIELKSVTAEPKPVEADIR